MTQATASSVSLPTGLTVGLLSALDALGVLWWIKDADGRYVQVNAAAEALLGADGAPVIGRTDADLLPQTLALALRAADHGAAEQPVPSLAEHHLEVAGVRRDVTAVRWPLPRQADGSRLLLGVWLDTSGARHAEAQLRLALQQLEEQQRANESLRTDAESRAQRDGQVVQLVQRDQFEDHLRREVDLSLREHREFAVVYVTVDPAPAGSPPHDAEGRRRVLEALGRLLRNNTRAMDAPSRLGDERFALLLSGVGLATAHSRMEGLRRQCATQLVALGGEALRFTVSMGVASFPHTSQTQASLLQAAEAALLQAQLRGGNHVALASIAFATERSE